MRISSITKNAGKACNNRLYRHIRTFEKIIKNYFVIYEKYINETGKTDISKRTDFKGEHLGGWINTQLKKYREGKLSDKRIELLKKTGLIK